MKYLIFLLISTLLSFSSLNAGTISVSATVEGKGFKAKKKAKALVQKEAAVSYALKKNKNIPKDKLEEFSNSYGEYIMFMTQNSIEYDRENKKTTVNYTVEIDDQIFNKKFNSLGLNVQGQTTKLIIIEEPLSLSNIDFFTNEDFVIYYKYLQNNIKDIINSKLNQYGFKVSDLTKDQRFNKFQKKSPNLLGVYYDYKRSQYVQDLDFISEVTTQYPDVIFVKYKLDFLTMNDGKIKAKLSMKLNDAEENNEISLGDLSYSIPLESSSFSSIMHSFSQSVKNIVSLLTNQLNEKVDEIIINKNNKPITYVVNLPDRRSAYKVKKVIGSMNEVFDLVVQANELIFFAKGDRDEFLYTKALPSIEDILNKTISDKYININLRKVIINTDSKEFNNNLKLQILFI